MIRNRNRNSAIIARSQQCSWHGAGCAEYLTDPRTVCVPVFGWRRWFWVGVLRMVCPPSSFDLDGYWRVVSVVAACFSGSLVIPVKSISVISQVNKEYPFKSRCMR
jgi:hypothetical protein